MKHWSAVLLLFVIQTPLVVNIECHNRNCSCCYDEVFPERQRSCCNHIEESVMRAACLQKQRGEDNYVMLFEQPHEKWYLYKPLLAARCCSNDECLFNDNYVEFPSPVLGAKFYHKVAYCTSFALVMLLITVFGACPFLCSLKRSEILNGTTAVDLDIQIPNEVTQGADANWPTENEIKQKKSASGLIKPEKMRKFINDINKADDYEKPSEERRLTEIEAVTLGEHFVHVKGGNDMCVYIRHMPTQYEVLLHQMLEHGPGAFNLDPMELNETLDQAFNIFASEASLVEISGPCVVVGELRASYPDIFRWLQVCGVPPAKKMIFAGGVFDASSSGSTETMALICAFKAVLPYDVFVLRGVREMTGYSFEGRYPTRIANGLSAAVDRMFSHMPLAALVDKKVLVVHSGISKKIRSPETLRRIRRPVRRNDMSSLVKSLIYDAPNQTVGKIDNGTGRWFDEDVVNTVCQQMDLEMIVRGRGPGPRGYFFFANRRLLSLWSQTGKQEGDSGSVAVIQKGFRLQLHSVMWHPTGLRPTLPSNVAK